MRQPALRHLNFPGNTEPFKRIDKSTHGTCRCCKMLGRITYNPLDSINYCKEQWQSCSWFDGFCTHHHCFSDQGRMAMCGAKSRYLEVYRVPKVLCEPLFTILARRTDAILVAPPWCVTQTTATITFKSVSNSLMDCLSQGNSMSLLNIKLSVM